MRKGVVEKDYFRNLPRTISKLPVRATKGKHIAICSFHCNQIHNFIANFIEFCFICENNDFFVNNDLSILGGGRKSMTFIPMA